MSQQRKRSNAIRPYISSISLISKISPNPGSDNLKLLPDHPHSAEAEFILTRHRFIEIDRKIELDVCTVGIEAPRAVDPTEDAVKAESKSNVAVQFVAVVAGAECVGHESRIGKEHESKWMQDISNIR